jgi:hypothetical protein
MAKIFLTFILRPCTIYMFRIFLHDVNFVLFFSLLPFKSSFVVIVIVVFLFSTGKKILLSQTLNHMYIYFFLVFAIEISYKIHNKSNLLYNNFVVLNNCEIFFFSSLLIYLKCGKEGIWASHSLKYNISLCFFE